MGLSFPAPFYDILVVPTGASSGARIVIDGTTGTIEIYDSANDLRIRMGMDASSIEFLTGDVDELTSGLIGTVIASGFPSDVLHLDLQSPGFGDTDNDQDHATISLISGSRDGTSLSPDIRTSLGFGTLGGGGQGDNISLGRGIISRQTLTSNSSGFTADSTTDMTVVNVPVHLDRTYGINLHSRWSINDAGTWALECHVNGSKIGDFDWVDATAARSGQADGTVQWEPSATATTDDITVVANELSGTSTLTFIAAANTPRWLTVIDMGMA